MCAPLYQECSGSLAIHNGKDSKSTICPVTYCGDTAGHCKNQLISTCQGIHGQEISTPGRSCPDMEMVAAPGGSLRKVAAEGKQKYSRSVASIWKCLRAGECFQGTTWPASQVHCHSAETFCGTEGGKFLPDRLAEGLRGKGHASAHLQSCFSIKAPWGK